MSSYQPTPKFMSSYPHQGFSLVAQMVKTLPAMQETQFNRRIGTIP